MTPLVEAHAVSRAYGPKGGEIFAVRDVTCSIHAGQLVLLMGPSGSGKTTLVSLLAGLTRPSSGAVYLDGRPISQRSDVEVQRIRRSFLGFVFQTPNLFPALTALDNVAEMLCMRGLRRPEALSCARIALESVGLGGRLHHRPSELSGGQKQRVAIARAIAGAPPLLIGDEITSALDTASARAVMEILAGYVGPKTAVLVVTHDARLEHYADRILDMEDGRLVRERALQRAARPAVSGGGA
ncbi:ABC transporter ATP-binding protein [Polyangium sp. y55x31]|uniref:ABC transporter ATP-binding protein n=1 Tax=Polyangium sp. y55x31 TaxID=3042688 RepID=UPI0024827641|nr:ABC transporter ATP-binding protein [Polyangium sp. y55x31]MDI1480363.1 ABC transporter ATP-binding protein [Polyangium sp. y55x31]